MSDTRQQILSLIDISNHISSDTSDSILYNTQYVTNPLLTNVSSMRLDVSNLYNTPLLFPIEYSYVEPRYESIPLTTPEAIQVFDTFRSSSDSEPEPVLHIDTNDIDDMEQSQFDANQRNNEITANILQSIGEGKSIAVPDLYNRYEFDGYSSDQNVYYPNVQ